MDTGDTPYSVAISIDIAAVLKTNNVPPQLTTPVKLLPYFRYTAFNGTRVLTDTVGRSGSTWTVVTPPAAEAAPAAAAAAADPKAKGKAPAGKDAKAPESVAPAGPTLVRHTTTIDGLTGTLDLAKAIHSSPVLHLFLGLKPEEAGAAGAGAAAGGKGAPAPAKGAPAPAATGATPSPALSRAYVAVLPLDLSSLLANAPCVSATYGSVAAADAAVRAAVPAPAPDAPPAPVWDVASLLGTPGLPSEDCTLPAPSLFDFLHISVRVSSCTQVQRAAPPSEEELKGKVAAASAAPAAVAAAPAAPAKGGKAPAAAPAAAAAVPSPAAPDGMAPVPIVPPRLFSATVIKQINPIVVSIGKAEGLPGIVLPAGVDASERKYVQPDAHALLRDQANPTWALLRFPGAVQGGQAGERGRAQYRLLDYKMPARPGSPGAVVGGETSEAETARALRVPFPAPWAVVTPARPAAGKIEFVPSVVPSSVHAAEAKPNPYAPSTVGGVLSDKGSSCTVLCLGLLPEGGITGLREALQTQDLDVELHDRDCPAYEDVQRAALSGSLAADAAADMALSAASATASTASAVTTGTTGTTGSKAGAPPVAAGAKPGTAAAAGTPKGGPTAPIGAKPPSTEPPSPFDELLSALLPKQWAWPTFALPSYRLESYEAIAAGAAPWPIMEQAAGSSPASGAVPSSSASTTTPAPAPAPAGSPSGQVYPGGKDVFELDPIVMAECAYRAWTAGDRHAHAHGKLRLESLLDRSTERAALLAKAGGRTAVDARAALLPSPALVQAAGMQPLAPVPAPVDMPMPASLSATVPLMPSARRVQPKLPEPLHLLTPAQLRVIAPGAYGQTGASIKVKVAVVHAPALHTEGLTTLPTPERPTFERAVAVFDYDDDVTLQAVLAVVGHVNTVALPHAGSYRTYTLTPDEVEAANTGKLDILTGVHVVDGVRRIIVLEGLSGPTGSGMEQVRQALPRKGLNTPSLTLLANPAVRFHNRLYTAFSTSPREFHLRLPLERITLLPALYRPRATPEALREALVCLANLVRADTAAQAKLMGDDAWPRVEGLEAMEQGYGDAITLADVYGQSHPAARAVQETTARLHQAQAVAEAHVPASTQHDLLLTVTLNQRHLSEEERAALDALASEEDRLRAAADRRAQRYARTANAPKQPSPEETAAYLRTLREAEAARASKDFIAVNRSSVHASSARVGAEKKSAELEDLSASLRDTGIAERAAALLHAGQTLDTLGKPLPGGQVHMYSNQTLNTGEWAKELQRERLAKEKGVTWARTASTEFGSLSLGISTVPEPQQKFVWNDKDGATSRGAWKTPQGWTSGDHNTLVEDVRGGVDAKRPSGWRMDQLAERYDDPADREAQQWAAERLGAAGSHGRPAFFGHPVPHPSVDKRGLLGYIDPQSGKQDWLALEASVFIGGDQTAERKAAAAAAKAKWKDALVVADTTFHPHHGKDGAARVFRYEPLVEGQLKKHALVEVDARTRTATGRLVAPTSKLPPSVFATQDVPYPGPPHDLGASLRPPADPMSFTARTRTGQPLDFTNILAPKDVQRGVTSKVYRPLIDAAVRGLAPPGVKPVLPTHVRGINTDRRVPMGEGEQ